VRGGDGYQFVHLWRGAAHLMARNGSGWHISISSIGEENNGGAGIAKAAHQRRGSISGIIIGGNVAASRRQSRVRSAAWQRKSGIIGETLIKNGGARCASRAAKMKRHRRKSSAA